MNFNYKTFYDWYQDHYDDKKLCDNENEAIVLHYNSTVKYGKNPYSKKQQFKVCENQKVAKFLPVKQSSNFPYGMFIVVDYKSKLGTMWLLFVFPRQKQNSQNETIDGLFADHYSFCYNLENKKKPVNFHSTSYEPLNDDGSEGQTDHFTRNY